MSQIIQLDVDPQQVILGNLQTGIQIVATINIEDLIDGITLQGQPNMASILGHQLIDLLKANGCLIDVINPQKHISNVCEHITDDYKYNK